MTIDKLNTLPNCKSITISMSYDEIKDTFHALYVLQKIHPEYERIYLDYKFLFDMIKYGVVQSLTVKSMYEYIKDQELKDSE